MLKTVGSILRPVVALLIPLGIAVITGCGTCNNCAIPAFRPTPPGGGSPAPSPTPTGVISCTASGTGAIGVLCTGGKTYAFVGKGNPANSPQTMTVEQIDISTGAASFARARTLNRPRFQQLQRPRFHREVASVFHTYSLSFFPTECSSDEAHLRVFCGGFTTSMIADISASGLTNTTFDTGASGTVSFTGGSCTICAIAYDPMDNAFIMLAATGGGEFDRFGEDSHSKTMSIPDLDPNENPGYDYVKNWIFTPQYNAATPALQIADFSSDSGSGKLLTASTTLPSNAATIDSGNVDVSTHVGFGPNEFTSIGNSYDVFTATLGTAALNSPSAGMFSGVTTADTLISSSAISTCGASLTDDATDSVLHVTFITDEFCDSGVGMGFVKLPTSGSGVPTIPDWAFVKVPNTPDGLAWKAAEDPHPVAAFNDPVNCPDCAIITNLTGTWMAVVNLSKLVLAPRSASDAHSIDPTYDLQANGVVKFYAI